MSFPDIVYRVPGPHFGPHGCTYDFRGVADESELDAALASGWFRSIEDARAPKESPAEAPVVDSGGFDDESPPSREELEQKATELGLKFDGRTTDKRLAERIAEALAAKE